jgi:hypothetical protein
MQVEKHPTSRLVIDLRAADALGVAVPRSLLLRATEVMR